MRILSLLMILPTFLICLSFQYEADAAHDGTSNDHFKTTYSLNVLTEPNLFYIEGTGLYDDGIYVTTGKAPEEWNGYKFVGWKIDGQWYLYNPATILMDRNHRAVAHYVLEGKTHNVTIDTVPRVGSVLVDGVLYLPTELPLEFEWDEGSTHTISAGDAVSEASGTRYVFDKWTDLSRDKSRTITMDNDMNIRAVFKTQHYLKIISEYGTAQGTGWYDKGQTVNFSISPTEVIDERTEGHRYLFAGWSDGDYLTLPENSIIVEKPTTIKANWSEQYLLTLTSLIPEIAVPGSGWYDKGKQVALVSAEEYQSSSADTKYVFDRWVSRGNNPVLITNPQSESASLVMDKAYNVGVEWKKSYYIEIITPYGKATGTGYYQEDTFANISITPTELEIENDKIRVVFDEFDVGDAVTRIEPSVGNEQNNQKIGVLVDRPMSFVAKWKTQYYLDVNSVQGQVSGADWYDKGSLARIDLKAPYTPAGLWARYTFDGWSGDYNGESLSGNVVMNKPKTVKAEWKEDYSPAVMNSSIMAGVGAAGMLVYRRTKRNANGNGNGGILPWFHHTKNQELPHQSNPKNN
ncbi:MAG: InlB B-repeat-containing protein [Nitrososphaerales archaeon]